MNEPNYSLKLGVKVIESYLDKLPQKAGIYQMINKNGDILYIGKAKNLPDRVKSYASPQRASYRIQAMIAQIAQIEIVTTATEAEALILEASLIKKYKPKYNILLKDDKSYPYILITNDHDFPQIIKHRGKQKIAGKYFGPFASAGSVNKAITDLQKAFLLRSCSDNFFNSRKRPCMEYQIKRCSAPCTNYVSKEDYNNLVKQALNFLSGKSRQIQEELVSLMEKASENMDYEKAAIYRDRIKALNHIQMRNNINISIQEDLDIIAIAKSGNFACIQVFFYRNGQNYGNQPFYFDNIGDNSESEILANFLVQFYQKNPPPQKIIINHQLSENETITKALSIIAGNKISIEIAGKKDNMLQISKFICDNAEIALQNFAKEQNKYHENLNSLAQLLGLNSDPKRIEIYDNSHISGQYNLGCMVVFEQNGFNKNQYRKFNVKDLSFNQADDYAMMEQMLMRRLKTRSNLPDLMIIDGGLGHKNIVQKLLEELKVNIRFICIAKGKMRNAGNETFFSDKGEVFSLNSNQKLLHFLQILRDEAHRYAITSHRTRRAKSMQKSALDDIENIGPKRRKLLINHFGSVAEITKASLQQIESLPGINKNIAAKIYEFFHGKNHS